MSLLSKLSNKFGTFGKAALLSATLTTAALTGVQAEGVQIGVHIDGPNVSTNKQTQHETTFNGEKISYWRVSGKPMDLSIWFPSEQEKNIKPYSTNAITMIDVQKKDGSSIGYFDSHKDDMGLDILSCFDAKTNKQRIYEKTTHPREVANAQKEFNYYINVINHSRSGTLAKIKPTPSPNLKSTAPQISKPQDLVEMVIEDAKKKGLRPGDDLLDITYNGERILYLNGDTSELANEPLFYGKIGRHATTIWVRKPNGKTVIYTDSLKNDLQIDSILTMDGNMNTGAYLSSDPKLRELFREGQKRFNYYLGVIKNAKRESARSILD